MTETYVDASFFVALLNPKDAHHAAAERFAAGRWDGLLTTGWVLAEVGNYFSRSANRRLFVELMELIDTNERLTVLPADQESFEAGLALFSLRPDKDWSFVDCISFAVMQKRGITDALTADHHFEQAGFRVLLK